MQLTKEVCIQIFSVKIGQALCGRALLLSSLFSSIGVDRRHNENTGLVD